MYDNRCSVMPICFFFERGSDKLKRRSSTKEGERTAHSPWDDKVTWRCEVVWRGYLSADAKFPSRSFPHPPLPLWLTKRPDPPKKKVDHERLLTWAKRGHWAASQGSPWHRARRPSTGPPPKARTFACSEWSCPKTSAAQPRGRCGGILQWERTLQLAQHHLDGLELTKFRNSVYLFYFFIGCNQF